MATELLKHNTEGLTFHDLDVSWFSHWWRLRNRILLLCFLNFMVMKRKYSEKAQEKIGEVMREFKKGKLKSSSGKKVTDRKQAVAIGISEAREAGYKVPKEKKDE
jgi:hypothetical protein